MNFPRVPDALKSVTERSSQERGSGETVYTAPSSEHSYTLEGIEIRTAASDKSDTPFGSAQVQARGDIERGEGGQIGDIKTTSSEPSPASIKKMFSDYAKRMGRRPKDSFERANSRPSAERRRSSNLGRGMSVQTAESIPLGIDPATFVAHRALRRSHENSNVRISLDLGPHSLESLDNARVHGRLVRRRRRLPLPIILFFGLMSVYAALIATCTLGIGVFNLTKLKASRAARTVDNLRNEIEPQLTEMLEILRAFLAGQRGGP